MAQNGRNLGEKRPRNSGDLSVGGSDIGPQLRGVNAIADAVGPLYPNVLIDTFAYLNTLPVPAVTKPRPNVIIRICIASCNFAAEYTDPVRLSHHRFFCWQMC